MNMRFANILPGRALSAAMIAALLAGAAPSALAQDTLAEARIRKMEAEIRALQRKVFPGGDGRFFEPQIQAQETKPEAPATTTTNAVTDILTRLDSLESQIARLTGQVEQNSNRLNLLEERLTGAAQASDAAATYEAPAAQPAAATPGFEATQDEPAQQVLPPVAAPAPAPAPKPAPAPSPASKSNLDAMTGGASAAKPAKELEPVAAEPSAERVKAVSAIVKPTTSDPADNEYSYGFRLWDAKFYPEAQQQLKLFLEQYPSHWRASWARNLLGRAYLDDGNPKEAAKWFLQNYQADKLGGRAADSLLYLAVSMKELKDTKRACIALAEFSETYAAEAVGRLQGMYDATRNGIDCGS